jgi:hypothetical protein
MRRLIELCRPLCVVWCVLVLGSAAPLAEAICDPSKPVASDPWDRYHERGGNRCEGVYGEQPVSGDIVGEIASFTLGPPRYELEPTPLTLAWPDAAEGPVRLRAVALREDLLYQMDAVQPPGTFAFAWPSEVLVHRKIGPQELGVRAWVVRPLLGRVRPLHLPLTVRQGDAASGAETDPGGGAERYVMVVVPGAALRKLEVALDRVIGTDEVATAPGEAREALEELKPYSDLGRGHYAANTAFPFALPVLSQVGTYRLRLRAEREDGEPDTESFWFMHAVP